MHAPDATLDCKASWSTADVLCEISQHPSKRSSDTLWLQPQPQASTSQERGSVTLQVQQVCRQRISCQLMMMVGGMCASTHTAPLLGLQRQHSCPSLLTHASMQRHTDHWSVAAAIRTPSTRTRALHARHGDLRTHGTCTPASHKGTRWRTMSADSKQKNCKQFTGGPLLNGLTRARLHHTLPAVMKAPHRAAPAASAASAAAALQKILHTQACTGNTWAFFTHHAPHSAAHTVSFACSAASAAHTPLSRNTEAPPPPSQLTALTARGCSTQQASSCARVKSPVHPPAQNERRQCVTHQSRRPGCKTHHQRHTQQARKSACKHV
jgi:hypothetical protein